MAKLSFPFILIAFLALAQAVVAQKTVPVTHQVPPFELSREYHRKEAIAKTSLLLAKLRYDIASSSIEPMVQAIDKWLLEPSLAPETKHLLQFVSQEVLLSLAEAKTTIISNEKALVGLKLKGRNQTEERIVSLDFDGVKLTQTTSKGSLDRTITWDVLHREGFLVPLCHHLLERTPPTLNNYKPYLALLLFCGQAPYVETTLNSLPAEETESLRNWLALAGIHRLLSPASKSIVELVDTLRLACLNADDYLAASTAQRILAANQAADFFLDSDRQAIAALLDKFSHALPDLQAGKLAREAKNLQRQGQVNAALNTALTAFFRFGRAAFPEKTALDDTIKEGFARLASPIPLQKGGFIDWLPFCNHYPPAHNLVACRDAATLLGSESNSRALESMLPLARFACGDWSRTNAFSASGKPLPPAFEKAPKDAQEMAICALIFAKVLGESRFSNALVSPKAFNYLRKRMQHAEQPDAHTMVLLSAAPLLIYGWNIPSLGDASAPSGANMPTIEQQFLTTYNYKGTLQARRTVFYQCLARILASSPSPQFRSDLLGKSQEVAFLEGYGFQGPGKRFFDRLVKYDGNQAEFPLEHIIDQEVDWAFQRAWIAVANTEQGLPSYADQNLMDYLEIHALNWPLQGGETIMAWLLARCANSLYNKKLDDAIQLTNWVLSRNYACLISHYPALLALNASLKALEGKTGGIQTAANLIQAAPISPKGERAAFRTLADLQPQFSNDMFNRWLATLPRHKEYTFWMNIMGTAIAFNLSKEPVPPMIAMSLPSQALFAKAVMDFTRK